MLTCKERHAERFVNNCFFSKFLKLQVFLFLLVQTNQRLRPEFMEQAMDKQTVSRVIKGVNVMCFIAAQCILSIAKLNSLLLLTLH